MIAKIVNLDRAEQRMLELRAALLNHAAAQYSNEVRMQRSIDAPVRTAAAMTFRANARMRARSDGWTLKRPLLPRGLFVL